MSTVVNTINNTTATTKEQIVAALFDRVIAEEKLTDKQIKKMNFDEKFFEITCLDLDEEAIAEEVKKLEKEGKIAMFTEREIYYGNNEGYDGYMLVHASTRFHFWDGTPHIDMSYSFNEHYGNTYSTATTRSWKDYINCAKYFAYLFNLKLCIY